jgi:pyruvate dehydrogenase E2 component (dihydrolipoamide acetyltransferase)
MAKIITLNKMTDTMSEGVLVKWTVKKGDEVKSGDILAEVETDKATMDLENFEKGTILELLAEEGLSLPVNSPIAIIGKVGEDISALIAEAKSGSNTSNTSPIETTTEKEAETNVISQETSNPIQNTATNSNTENGRIKISPLAKKLAGDKGIDIQSINGSGEGGRIVKKDVENYSPASKATVAQTSSSSFGVESFSEVPVSQMRKTIANRLAESKFSAPHFYLTMEIEMNRLLEARERINANGEHKISVNDMIVKASAMALIQNPAVNSSWLGDKIRYNNHVHIGVAVAVDEGLLVPVVRFANHKSLSAISAEVKDFGKKARDKKLQPADWQGNTFTISNLGMFGIEEFTAIINPPDACILAVGSVKEVLALNNGDIEVKKVMKVTLSCDHRVVDGVVGSKFLQTLKSYLEDPIKMLV